MRVREWTFALLLAALTAPAAAEAQLLLSQPFGTGDQPLVLIDAQTGPETPITGPLPQMTRTAYDATRRHLYFSDGAAIRYVNLQSGSTHFVTATTELPLEFDPVAGQIHTGSTFPLSTIDVAGRRLITKLQNNAIIPAVWTIVDLATGSSTSFGTQVSAGYQWAFFEFDNISGRLLGASACCPGGSIGMFEIDTVTGKARFLAPIAAPEFPRFGISAFDSASGRIYYTPQSGSVLAAFDPLTLTTTTTPLSNVRYNFLHVISVPEQIPTISPLVLALLSAAAATVGLLRLS
jgi:hypothetical protein